MEVHYVREFFRRKRTEELEEAGAKQPPPPPPPPTKEESKQAAESQIDAFMRKVGIEDPSTMTDEKGWRFLKLGSAEGRAGVVESENELYFCAEAIVMPLPSDNDLILPLMRSLLELNAGIAGMASIGIENEMVVVKVTRQVGELQPDDFASCIHSVMSIADNLDDKLIEKYGGTSKKRVTLDTPPSSGRTRQKKKGE